MVWDTNAHKEEFTLPGGAFGITRVCFSPDGKRIVSGSEGELKLWEASPGIDQDRFTLCEEGGQVGNVWFSPDGNRIVTESADNTAKVWDTRTGKVQFSLAGHKGKVTNVCFSPDSKRIVTGSLDETVKVWDAETGQEEQTLTGDTGPVTRICYSPDGKRIAWGGWKPSPKDKDKFNKYTTLAVWDAETRQVKLIDFRPLLEGRDTSVWFSRDGKRIYSNGFAGTYVWDASTYRIIEQQMNPLNSPPIGSPLIPFFPGLCVSGDGQRFATSGHFTADRQLMVRDAETGDLKRTLSGHTGAIACACFSPDGKRIVSGSADQTVKVWDVATGMEAFTLRGHTDRIIGVAFSSDGKRLLSVSADGIVKVWADNSRQ